jgi:hypothetical protein
MNTTRSRTPRSLAHAMVGVLVVFDRHASRGPREGQSRDAFALPGGMGWPRASIHHRHLSPTGHPSNDLFRSFGYLWSSSFLAPLLRVRS